MTGRLVAEARCLLDGCPWTCGPSTDTAAVDLEARRHSGDRLKGGPWPPHPTETSLTLEQEGTP